MDRGRKRKGYMENGNKEQREAQMRMGKRDKGPKERKQHINQQAVFSLIFPIFSYITSPLSQPFVLHCNYYCA